MTDQNRPRGGSLVPGNPGLLHNLLDTERRTMLAARKLPDEGSLPDAVRDELREAVKAYIAEHKLSHKQVAKEIGRFRANTLSEILSGGYKGKIDEYLRDLNNWMEVDARRRAAGVNRRFVETTVARKILIAAEQASSKSIIALVHGPSGIGKTMTAEALHQRYPGSIYIRLDDGTRTALELRAALRDVLRLDVSRGRAQGRQGPLHRRIVETLFNSGRLLIIDEGHKIANSGLEYLRDLYDLCAIPILLLATKDLLTRIRRDATPDHGQLYSRIDYVCDLWSVRGEAPGSGTKLFSIHDIRKLWESDTVRLSPDAQTYLLDLANQPGYGSLRSCGNLVRWADKAARALGKLSATDKVTITADLLNRIELEHKPDWSMRSDMRSRSSLVDQPLAATG